LSDGSRALPRLLAPLALMGLIFLASAQSDPGPDLGGVLPFVFHAAQYAALAALWTWSLEGSVRRAWPWAAALSFAYALSDEWHQSFVPGRDADPFDIVADSVGIALALLVLRQRARSRTA
jgi:VanZ family protein